MSPILSTNINKSEYLSIMILNLLPRHKLITRDALILVQIEGDDTKDFCLETYFMFHEYDKR